MVEPSLVLYGALYERAMGVLKEPLREPGARSALFIARKGFALPHKEALGAPNPPPLDSLATLVAGNAAATQALAKLLGEARFQEVVHQGEHMGLYVDEAGEHALLLLVFDENAPLGKVKLHGKRAAETLARIAEEAIANPPKLHLDTEYREGA
ncbi:roadblock/LC7 domain-containing protein, partial [Thermus aquaticus]|uniref:GTPase-activating protein MglB n=1 Tax=Thermus aquaticus TaxID=271 RepID=UPI0006B2102C